MRPPISIAALAGASLLLAASPAPGLQPEEDEPEEAGSFDDEEPFVPRGPSPEVPPPGDEPPPAPARSPAAAAPASDPAPQADDAAPVGSRRLGARPSGLSVGIGAGYLFPADLRVPNLATVRFRLPGGLTLEPLVEARSRTEESELLGATSTDKETILGLALLVRAPLLSRGRVDLTIAGGGLARHEIDDPEGADNDTRRTVVGLVWGLGVEAWLGSRVSVGFTALNPLFLFARTAQDVGPGAEASSTTRDLGLVFDPEVILTLHLFY